MRITSKEVSSNMQFHIMRNYNKLSNLQETIATGRRLNRPSDDPVDVVNDMELRSRLSALKQYRRNIDDGLAFMGVTDTALVSMNDLNQRIRELSIQANNGTLTGEERKYIGLEVDQLLRQLISLIDTTYKGEYIFGGTNNHVAPYTIESGTFNATGAPVGGGTESIEHNGTLPAVTNVENILPGSVRVVAGGTTYAENVDYTIDYMNATITRIAGGGMDAVTDYTVTYEWVKHADEANTDEIYREVEEGVNVRINTSADDVFIDRQSSVNVVEEIISLGQALVQDDVASIMGIISNLDIGFENILGAQATNGARMNRFDKTLFRNDNQVNEVTRLHSELEDADLAEIISEFSLLENVYTASLQAGAKVIQQSLVNFLR